MFSTIDLPLIRGAKGGADPPKIGAVEGRALTRQTDIADWQWQVAQDQYNVQNALLPFYLQEAGYDYAPYQGGTEYDALRDKQADIQKKLRYYDDQYRMSQAWKDQKKAPFEEELKTIQGQIQALGVPDNLASYGGREYTISKREDPLEATNKEIAQLAGERQLKALKGELDVDPAVQQDLARQEETLHEELIRRLGPGYAGTDAGQRALSEFERNKNMVNYQVRHGEMSAANILQRSAEDAYRGNRVQRQSSLQGFSHFPGSAANTASGGAAGYGQISNQLGNQRMQAYQQQSQNAAAQGQLWGGLASGGLSAAGGLGMAYIMAPAV